MQEDIKDFVVLYKKHNGVLLLVNDFESVAKAEEYVYSNYKVYMGRWGSIGWRWKKEPGLVFPYIHFEIHRSFSGEVPGPVMSYLVYNPDCGKASKYRSIYEPFEAAW